MLHAGPRLVHYQLRENYWIINGKNVIRSILHKCLLCFRFKAKQSQQLMGQLPSHRTQVTYKPFMNSGIDYAGPLTIRHGGRNSKIKTKCYVALFICLSTKAIHLELVSDLSTHAFLAALRRFTSRRGLCSNIYSDNGTNFVGANNLLRSMYSFLNTSQVRQKIVNSASENGIQWHFIPPNSPHFGGLWEAAVKSVKFHLRRAVGNVAFTFEELNTILTQIEACLNSRPLCALSCNPSDPKPLTPGHFLVGGPLTSLPDHNLTDLPINRFNRWQLVQRCVQHVWDRWSADYLSQLQQRSKWKSESPSLKPGNLVLMKEDNIPALQWKLGIVENVHPGPDNLVRVVTVRNSLGVFKRPVTKLCPLPTSD
ncbi:uncharacterized protein LOC142317485 [Lycorma delicatula]|uniref:uncharacterized protein LOC142317485 n=1 Tax=Lycorma delicatula TaxID=130591 RepID=UPI003F51047C